MEFSAWAMAPFIAQGVIIGLDEGVFHLRRGLPLWERWGHPLDTATVLACFVFVLAVPASLKVLPFYIAMALFSCVFVTKDEFVHKECCPAAEMWLHALLFLNHPVLLSVLGLLWCRRDGVALPEWILLPEPDVINPFLWSQVGLVTAFLVYQVVYWNFLWKPASAPSTTPSTTT
jgi:hypothetical protein